VIEFHVAAVVDSHQHNFMPATQLDAGGGLGALRGDGSKYEYVLELNFMCLTDLNGSTANGATVAVEPCTGATDQIWSGS
jgi:hypothetical protein